MILSIVVNMYNTAKYMPKCLDSLLEQDILPSDYEIILVNDGSTDNSLELAEEYLTKSKDFENWPLFKIVNQENKGLAAARNAGIDVAEGKFLCFVDPDDYIEKNSLKELLYRMEDKNLDILRFNYQKVDEDYNNIQDFPSEANFNYSEGVISGKEFLVNRLGIACYVWAYIYRLDLIRKNNIRFIETCYFDDTPWLPRVLVKAERVESVPVRHQFYLQRQGSMVRTKSIESIKRKVDGQIKLVSLLKEQMQGLDPFILRWYNKMIAHTVLSLLTSVAVNLYSECDIYIKKIKDYNLLPLLSKDLERPKRIKSSLINLSPTFFCWMINLKNKH